MEFGMCVAQTRMDEVAEAGFDFCEISVFELLEPADGAPFAAWAKKVSSAAAPVKAVNAFFPATMRVTGADVDIDAIGQRIEKAVARAGAANIPTIVFGSGGARRLDENTTRERGWEQLAAVARLAGEAGAKHGVTIAMEPLLKRACNLFNTVDQGIGFVDKINHPNLRLLADLFHMEANGESFASIVEAGARLAHIHLATPSLPETGEGIKYDFAGFFAALRAAGYNGRVTVEDNPGLLGKHEPPMVNTYRAIREFLRTVSE